MEFLALPGLNCPGPSLNLTLEVPASRLLLSVARTGGGGAQCATQKCLGPCKS